MSKRSTMAKRDLLLPFVWIFFRLSSCYINEQVDLIPYDVPEDNTFNFDDDKFLEYSLKSPFAFFKNTYDRVFISGNGQVSFSAGTETYTPSCSPSSIPMIMAFWADAINRDAESKLLYRESIDRNLLRRVSLDVFRGFPNLRGIQLSWMLIVTLKDLPFFGVSAACDGLSKRNTFQLVLTTDGHHSFAVMYYKRIDWTTGTVSSGNCYGLGDNPGKAGFDFGDAQNIFTIPGSCTDSILNITQTSNINSPGKYVFRIDSNLETKECNQFDNSQKLRVSPYVVSPYGHIPLMLTGPCVFPTDKILCTYYVADKKIGFDGTPDSISNTVVCPMPSFDRLGKIIVKITISRETGPDNDYHNGSSSNNHSPSTESNMYFGSFLLVLRILFCYGLTYVVYVLKSKSIYMHVDAGALTLHE